MKKIISSAGDQALTDHANELQRHATPSASAAWPLYRLHNSGMMLSSFPAITP